jgi:signal transduction histidine kinase
MHKRDPSLFMHCNGCAANVEGPTVLESGKEDNDQPLTPKAACCETAQVLADRIHALQGLTASLSHAFSSGEVVRVLVHQVRRALRASGAAFLIKTGEAEGWEIAGVAGITSEAGNACRDRMNTNFQLAKAVLEVNPIWFESPSDVWRYYSDTTAREALKDCRSMACLPLILERGASGMLLLSFSEPRTFNREEREFILQLTAQCAQALSRSRLFEAERRARAEAEEINRTKDTFLATVSHELRTPLTAILGWSRMLSGEKPDPSRYAHGLETIERNARAQEQLIDDLLDVMRIKTGKLRLHVDPVELSSVIDSVIDTLQPLADSKHIRLQRITTSKTAYVLGDQTRLQQVMWNLLSNAIKFTPREGYVLVQLERVDSHLEVKVTDTGEGIGQDFLPYVFEPYRQPDGSTRGQGLGLGLAIVRQLVELHRGTVRAESSGKGQGSCFTVSLPLMVAQKAPQAVGGALITNKSGGSLRQQIGSASARSTIELQSASLELRSSAKVV